MNTPAKHEMPEEIFVQNNLKKHYWHRHHLQTVPFTKYIRSDLAARPVEAIKKIDAIRIGLTNAKTFGQVDVSIDAVLEAIGDILTVLHK